MATVLRQAFRLLAKSNKVNLFKPQTNLASILSQKYATSVPTPYEIVDVQEDRKAYQKIIDNVNEQIAKKQQGRLFAVVHVAGKQFKITEGDVIVIEGYWPPTAGDKITLDKVLLAGGSDFTLIGRPLVQRGLVQVQATIIEKSVSHTKTHFRKKRRKQYMRIHFYRIPQTMLRINSIDIIGEVNHPPDVSAIDNRI